jgi:hypothetical protein
MHRTRLGQLPIAGMVDQDAARRSSSVREEMPAPVEVLVPDQPLILRRVAGLGEVE